MNKIILSASLLTLAAMMPMSASVYAQEPEEGRFPIIEGGVGPAISGSVEYTQIPLQSRKFIDREFKGLTVIRAEREFATGKVEVELSDGSEIEFNSKGEWTEIDAPDDEVFIVELLSKLIPDRARRELRRRKVDTKVETVKRSATGYTIELRGEKIDEYLFSSDGRLLGMRD